MFLFMRFMPVINIFEMKDLLYKKNHANEHDDHGTHGHAEATPAFEGKGGEE
jgi:hypothetical protein